MWRGRWQQLAWRGQGQRRVQGAGGDEAWPCCRPAALGMARRHWRVGRMALGTGDHVATSECRRRRGEGEVSFVCAVLAVNVYFDEGTYVGRGQVGGRERAAIVAGAAATSALRLLAWLVATNIWSGPGSKCGSDSCRFRVQNCNRALHVRMWLLGMGAGVYGRYGTVSSLMIFCVRCSNGCRRRRIGAGVCLGRM